ncbi:MAG: IS200/IS605 family transposase [Planctomycetes bacterium]|nr:IS200/IS605 family transposase [Planctomycetota bacterium]
MPQSLSLVVVHLIFSTHGRKTWLSTEWLPNLHAYLASVTRNKGCECFRVGGTADHVHLAIRLSRTETIADVVEEVKTASSKWVKEQDASLGAFAWQRGYAAFSVSPKDVDALVAYIDNQAEHHRTRSFQDEFRALLTKYGVDFDERYAWD